MPVTTLQRSTDRDYIYQRFIKLSHDGTIDFIPNTSYFSRAASGVEYVKRRLVDHLAGSGDSPSVLTRVPIPSEIDLVFAYGLFPLTPFGRRVRPPVLWEQTFAPPSLGVEAAEWRDELIRTKRVAALMADRVVTATPISAQWFAQTFPEAAEKIRVIPYFLPDIEPISEQELDTKRQSVDPIRVLFIGKQGRRKGLDAFVDAWRLLPKSVCAAFSVKVVSALLDGKVELPSEWHYSPYVASPRLEMEKAHVLVFPTRREAFGLVLVEAMSQGCVPVTSSAPIQRSIVGENAGLFVNPNEPEELAKALIRLSQDQSLLSRHMAASRARFIAEHYHVVVGRKYQSLLIETSGLRP